MQNKQAVVGIIAAVIILIGAGAVYSLDKTKNSTPEPASIAKSISPTPVNTSTIAGIFKSTKNQKCDFDTKTESGVTKGTVYASNENAYADINTSSSNSTQTISVIKNAETFYIWGDALPTGVKMTMSVDEMGEKLSNSGYSNLDPNQKTNFTCVGWTPDESKFIPPTTVKFLNLGGGTTPTGKQVNSKSPSDQCSICNSLTGSAKTACLSSFSCK